MSAKSVGFTHSQTAGLILLKCQTLPCLTVVLCENSRSLPKIQPQVTTYGVTGVHGYY